MSLFNPFAALFLTMEALLFIFLLARFEARVSPAAGRFLAIDGLRGYLAFFVFVHHSAVWYGYLRTDLWETPSSTLYTQLGQSGVCLFFMITSFLFYNKLLESRHKVFDWTAFFIGRFLRLTPLYLLVAAMVLLIVAIMSHGVLQDSIKYTIRCIAQWIAFCFGGLPDINRIPAARIVAGATWSLPFEWLFYCSLPLLALTTGQAPKWQLLLLAIAALALGRQLQMPLDIARIFTGGIIAALLARHALFRRFAATPAASAIVVGALAFICTMPTAYNITGLLALTVAFSLIAGGASVFGVLTHATSRQLGELAYSIYLLHGIVLFVAFHFVLGTATVASMAPLHYWLLIAALVPCLLVVATLTFRFVEQPGIAMSGTFLARRKARLSATPA